MDAISSLDAYFLEQQVEKRFLHWIDEAKIFTEKVVDEHWEKIETLALKLIEKEIVESDELSSIVGKEKSVYNIPPTL